MDSFIERIIDPIGILEYWLDLKVFFDFFILQYGFSFSKTSPEVCLSVPNKPHNVDLPLPLWPAIPIIDGSRLLNSKLMFFRAKLCLAPQRDDS